MLVGAGWLSDVLVFCNSRPNSKPVRLCKLYAHVLFLYVLVGFNTSCVETAIKSNCAGIAAIILKQATWLVDWLANFI